MPTIILGEACSGLIKPVSDGFSRSVPFKITNKFKKKILKGPRYFGEDAILFGPLFPSETFELVSTHYCDWSQTAILDITRMPLQEYDRISDSSLWDELYLEDRIPWDNRDRLQKIQSRLSKRILFLGQTIQGANVYVHRNAQGEVDSMVIWPELTAEQYWAEVKRQRSKKAKKTGSV
jgi:hypothetical protein